MDRYLADPIAGAYLGCMARQLGRGLVLVWSNGKTRHDLGLASLPHPDYRGSRTLGALDGTSIGRATVLACRQRRYVPACDSDVGGYVVHVVGANSSRTLLVERDYAQG